MDKDRKYNEKEPNKARNKCAATQDNWHLEAGLLWRGCADVETQKALSARHKGELLRNCVRAGKCWAEGTALPEDSTKHRERTVSCRRREDWGQWQQTLKSLRYIMSALGGGSALPFQHFIPEGHEGVVHSGSWGVPGTKESRRASAAVGEEWTLLLLGRVSHKDMSHGWSAMGETGAKAETSGRLVPTQRLGWVWHLCRTSVGNETGWDRVSGRTPAQHWEPLQNKQKQTNKRRIQPRCWRILKAEEIRGLNVSLNIIIWS